MMRGSEEDKEKEEKKTARTIFNTVRLCVCVCAPVYSCKDGYAYVCAFKTCASGCVFVHVNMCIPVWVDGTSV